MFLELLLERKTGIGVLRKRIWSKMTNKEVRWNYISTYLLSAFLVHYLQWLGWVRAISITYLIQLTLRSLDKMADILQTKLSDTFSWKKLRQAISGYSAEENVRYINFQSVVGITKAPFVNFSVSKIFDLAKVPARFFESHLFWQVSPQLSCGDTCQIWIWYSIASVCSHDPEKLRKYLAEEGKLVQ